MLTPEEVRERVIEIALDLREMRQRKEISQKKMGELMGVGQGNFSALELSKTTPNIATLIRWADAMDCELLVLPIRRKKSNGS